MYNIEVIKSDVIGIQGKMRGPGVKCPERLAIEGLKPGTMVRIPKEAARQSSVSAWAVTVSREKGHKVRVKSAGDHWVVYVNLIA